MESDSAFPFVLVSLFAVGFVVATLFWLGLRALPRRQHAIDDLRTFAARNGIPVHGDGTAEALRFVGEARGRMFTVLYQAGGIEGPVLLIGVDCDSAAKGEHARGDVRAEAGDSTLASRWFSPPPEITGGIGKVLDAMVDMAEELERREPPTGGEAEE
jgi:hypothetical protein